LTSLLADDAAFAITRVLLSGVGVADTLVPFADTVRNGVGYGYSERIAQKFDFDKSEFVGGWCVQGRWCTLGAVGGNWGEKMVVDRTDALLIVGATLALGATVLWYTVFGTPPTSVAVRATATAPRPTFTALATATSLPPEPATATLEPFFMPTETPAPPPDFNPVKVTPEPTQDPFQAVDPEPTQDPFQAVDPEPTQDPFQAVDPEPTQDPFQPVNPEPTLEPTIEPTPEATAEPTAIPVPTATFRPVTVLSGVTRWSGNKMVNDDVQVAAGGTLIIEAGSTVEFAPGVSVYVQGQLQAIGQGGAPVLLKAQRTPWGGMFVQAGGSLVFDGVVVNQGGGAGTLIYSEDADVTIRNSTFQGNYGQFNLNDTTFLLSNSVVRDNTIAYGPMVAYVATYNNSMRIEYTRVGPNQQVDGAAAVMVTASNALSTLDMHVIGSLFTTSNGPNMQVTSASPLQGSVTCSVFNGGSAGMHIKSTMAVVPGIGLMFRDNAFENHGATYHTARALTSDVVVDAQGNWWGHKSGPYHPIIYAAGRGESVGTNVNAGAWLRARPACAPVP
jgi:hypothetical protein